MEGRRVPKSNVGDKGAVNVVEAQQQWSWTSLEEGPPPPALGIPATGQRIGKQERCPSPYLARDMQGSEKQGLNRKNARLGG